MNAVRSIWDKNLLRESDWMLPYALLGTVINIIEDVVGMFLSALEPWKLLPRMKMKIGLLFMFRAGFL